jgi:hypothetical protein
MVFLISTRRVVKGLIETNIGASYGKRDKNHPLSLGSSGHFSKDPFTAEFIPFLPKW